MWNRQTQSTKIQTSQCIAVHTCDKIHMNSVKAPDPIHENTDFSSQSHSRMWKNSHPWCGSIIQSPKNTDFSFNPKAITPNEKCLAWKHETQAYHMQHARVSTIEKKISTMLTDQTLFITSSIPKVSTMKLPKSLWLSPLWLYPGTIAIFQATDRIIYLIFIFIPINPPIC